MATRSHKRFDSGEPKYRHEHAEDLHDDSDDDNDDSNDSTDESSGATSTERSSSHSDNSSSAEIESGDESSDSSCVTESGSDEESTELRSKTQEEINNLAARTFTARSGRQWTTTEPQKYKVPSANILRQKRGIGRPATGIQTVQEAFDLMITPEMIALLVRETNRRASCTIRKCNDENRGKEQTWKGTHVEEIRAFIGLLILAGVYRWKNKKLSELWSMMNGLAVFRATMSETRFKALLRFCRFDNGETRSERVNEDKLASIRELWTMFLTRLQLCYTPSGSLTIDEQLVPTRGRCGFRQYMPTKPGKYGPKLFCCCDSDTAYPLTGEVYLGRQPNATASNVNDNRINSLVKRLVQPWINTGRTITTDNYFTNAELAEDLLGVHTTLVGTIRRSRREIP